MNMDRIVRVRTREEWREWLRDHHVSVKDCWFVSLDDQAVGYLDAVEEALCFGWVDSTTKKTEDGRRGQRFSPRRKGSNWTELNKERVRRLESLGLMTDAGRKACPDLSPEAFAVHEDVMSELLREETVYRNYLALPPLYARVRIDNIQSVRRDEELFRNRLAKFVENTRNNVIYGQWNDGGRLLEY